MHCLRPAFAAFVLEMESIIDDSMIFLKVTGIVKTLPAVPRMPCDSENVGRRRSVGYTMNIYPRKILGNCFRSSAINYRQNAKTTVNVQPPDLFSDLNYIRQMAEQAFSRSAGAPLISGNQVDLLFDCAENFPAWESAIAGARESILIEMYIFADNRFGRRLRDLLVERAAAGVRVCLLYDWMGSLREHLRGFFKPIAAAGGKLCVFNPPSLSGGLSLFGRDHRKLIIVDQRVAFVSGLCASSVWEGNPEKDIAPWRDTGVRIRGPLVASAVAAFTDSWLTCGGTLPDNFHMCEPAPCGEVDARLIATKPDTANIMRLDLLITSFARQTLWLTDAYFIGTGVYLTALKRAARDGVDVRLLVPRSSDIGWIATVSRTQYRPLLEAGVRVFEWNGEMIHAKTAVADGRWARIGSTNLNLSSWMANRELDISIEDSAVATRLAERFQLDLQNSTEVVLGGRRRRPILSKAREKETFSLSGASGGSFVGARAAARQAARIGDALGVVVRGTRNVDASEASSFLSIGLFLLLLGALLAFFPYLIVAPLVLVLTISSVAVIARSLTLYRARRKRRAQAVEHSHDDNHRSSDQ